jgi:hypothetical protein
MWARRPLGDLYTFYQSRNSTLSAYVGSLDLTFLEVFAPGNKYTDLLDLDDEGKVSYENPVPRLSVAETLEVVDRLTEDGWETCVAVVKRLLRLEDLAEYTGDRAIELAVAAQVAYG